MKQKPHDFQKDGAVSDAEAFAIPLVQRCLPEEGLEAFLDRSWENVSNAANHAYSHPQAPDSFPLEWVAMAPNSARFLASLRRPLAIAHDLESSPGIWWLATPDKRFNYIVLSDCHRKNAWRGGQFCMDYEGLDGLTPQHPGLVALCRGFENVWGRPSQGSSNTRALFEAEKWFEARSPTVHWPAEEAFTVEPRRPRPL